MEIKLNITFHVFFSGFKIYIEISLEKLVSNDTASGADPGIPKMKTERGRGGEDLFFFFKLLFHFSITSRYSSVLKLYCGLNIYIYIYIYIFIYIYIGLRREKGGGRYTKVGTINVMIDGMR